MKRATLTVRVSQADGRPTINFDVMQLTCNFNGTVTLLCSGNPITVKKEDIVGVEYGEAEWCGMCDQSISHFSSS